MKKAVKGVAIVLIAGILLALGLFIYARFIEPGLLAVRRETIVSDKVSGIVRIAVVADIHIGTGGMGEGRLQKIMDAVAAEGPDIVVFVGDLFDNYSRYSEGNEAALAGILAIPALPDVPKYAVYGNHDLGGKGQNAFRTVLEEAGWHILVNQKAAVLGLNLMGSDELFYGTPAIEPLIDRGGEAFNLLLVHEPDIGTSLTDVDLQLSGHTHGGQISLPFVGPVVLPPQGRVFVRGLYEKPDGGKVYVSSGLGMSTLPFRFGVVPEINVITLTGAE